MFMQLVHLVRTATAAIRKHVQAVGHARSRRSLRYMLDFDERLLRDIGLTRADVVKCLSAPDYDPVVDFLEDRRARRRPTSIA